MREQRAEGLVVAGHRMVGSQAELGQYGVDQGGIVHRVHGQGIACGIGDARPGEVQLVVPDLLVGSGRREQPVDHYAGFEGVVPVGVGRCGLIGSVCRAAGHDDAGSGRGVLCCQELDHVRRPRRGRLGVGAVDLDAFGQPSGAQLLETFVEQSAGVTEQVVAGVAEGEHRESQVFQTVGGVGAQSLPEQVGVVGELAVAPGRGDDDEVGG